MNFLVDLSDGSAYGSIYVHKYTIKFFAVFDEESIFDYGYEIHDSLIKRLICRKSGFESRNEVKIAALLKVKEFLFNMHNEIDSIISQVDSIANGLYNDITQKDIVNV